MLPVELILAFGVYGFLIWIIFFGKAKSDK